MIIKIVSPSLRLLIKLLVIGQGPDIKGINMWLIVLNLKKCEKIVIDQNKEFSNIFMQLINRPKKHQIFYLLPNQDNLLMS
jgi:hypothetical protein